MKGFLILLIVFYLSVFNFALAANPLDVIINEVTWMGTTVSANDEWIELYNNTENPINLDGWQLVSQDGTPKINLSGIIPANGFYLLERTDDTTVPNVPADQIYTGALGNAGETLELYDNFGNLIDRVDNSSGWSAGDNETKQTMERIAPGEWQTSQNPGGTPKEKNSIVVETSQPEPTIEPAAKDSPPQPQQVQTVYPSGIVINEILPSPEGPDEKEEWIEIFNQNNFEVALSGWQITDTVGRTTTYIFPVGTKISPQGFSALSRPTTKITLNNSEDGLLLIQPNGNILDSVNYQKAPLGQSYNRTPLENDSLTGQAESGWVWSSVLTPGSENTTSAPQPAEQEQKEKEEKSEAEPLLKSKKDLAAIGEHIPGAFDSLHIFSIALGLAIFSGVIILIIKRKLKNASSIID